MYQILDIGPVIKHRYHGKAMWTLLDDLDAYGSWSWLPFLASTDSLPASLHVLTDENRTPLAVVH